MAEKTSMLILKVDLDCRQCYKKIRKILCKLQDQERIRTVSYDDGSNTIAVAGPFDPHKLSCRIRCMGGKVIKGIEIMQDGGGCGGGGGRPEKMSGQQPMNNGKKKNKVKPRESPPAEAEQPPPENPPADPQPAHPSDSHISAGPPMIEDTKPKEVPVEHEPRSQQIDYYPAAERPRERLPPPPPSAAKPVWPVDMTPTTVEIPSWPALPASAGPEGHCGCSCCPPCYRGYYEGCRCCSCGRVYGYAVGVLPPPAGCYAEDPASACTIM